MSATTPEGRVKQKIKLALDKYKGRVRYWMPVPSGYGKSSLDFEGAFKGRAFAIEAKKPGGKPTKRQEGTIEEMLLGGYRVFVIDGDEALAPLEAWLVQTDAEP